MKQSWISKSVPWLEINKYQKLIIFEFFFFLLLQHLKRKVPSACWVVDAAAASFPASFSLLVCLWSSESLVCVFSWHVTVTVVTLCDNPHVWISLESPVTSPPIWMLWREMFPLVSVLAGPSPSYNRVPMAGSAHAFWPECSNRWNLQAFFFFFKSCFINSRFLINKTSTVGDLFFS